MDKQKIELFWAWFQTQKNEELESLITSVNERIRQLSFGLSIELDFTKTPKRLTVTPQGMKQYFANAYELVGAAPIIEGWRVEATRVALTDYADAEMDESIIKIMDVTFMPLNAKEHPDDLAIRLYHKDYVTTEGEKQKRTVNELYGLLDRLLGEESATFDFQYIDFDDMPHPKETDYPLSQLTSFIEHKKGTRKSSGQKFPKEDIGLLEGKVEELPTLLVINHGLKYYEFTKDFPYLFRITLELNNTGDNGLPSGNTDELYALEDIFYKGIYKEEKGHFIATETYNEKREMFYYANSLETIEMVLASVPKELKSCEFSYEVNYDPFWIMVESYIYM